MLQMDEKGNVFFLKKDEFEEKKRNPRGERRKQVVTKGGQRGFPSHGRNGGGSSPLW